MTPTDQKLEQLLDETLQAIRHARFGDLQDLGLQTEACLAALSSPPDIDMAQRLRSKAERNAKCLQAAGRGLRAARQRMEEVLAARRGSETYDGNGRKTGLGTMQQVTRRV